jgi:hypothetical protein
MTTQPANEHELCGSELESTLVATALCAATDAHQRPTLVPPSSDELETEPPPTVRWTPPPVLIARSRFDERVDDARRGSTAATTEWTRR